MLSLSVSARLRLVSGFRGRSFPVRRRQECRQLGTECPGGLATAHSVEDLGPGLRAVGRQCCGVSSGVPRDGKLRLVISGGHSGPPGPVPEGYHAVPELNTLHRGRNKGSSQGLG